MLKALDFILDGKLLSQYEGWFIQTISSTEKQGSSGEVQIFQDFVYKNPIPYFQGASYQGNKSITVRIGKTTLFDELEGDMLKSWLEGYVAYRPITFIQDDLTQIHMNVIIQSVETNYIGNRPAYLTLNMICDSPFAYEGEKAYNLNLGVNTLINTSSNNDYTYPILEFKSTSANGIMTLKNVNDGNKIIQFTGMVADEIITIDNRLKIVSSNLRSNVLSNFNKKWLRLIQGGNQLELSGNVTDTKVKYRNVRKVV